MTTRLLLGCGILSSLLYAAMSTLIGYQGYDPFVHTISELSAVGAPTRPLWLILGAVWGLLLLAFGFGVWAAAAGRGRLRVAAGLLIAFALLGLLWPFAPMHQRAVLAAGGATLSDTLHLVLAGASVVLMLAAVGFAASALGKGFRLYSAATVAAMLAFGLLTALDAPRVQADLPTPFAGLFERINVLAFLLWVAVLAIALLHRPAAAHRHA